MENIKKKRCQVTFDTGEDIKAQIKIAAALRYMSVSRWLNKCVRKELRATMENPIKHCECFKDI